MLTGQGINHKKSGVFFREQLWKLLPPQKKQMDFYNFGVARQILELRIIDSVAKLLLFLPESTKAVQ